MNVCAMFVNQLAFPRARLSVRSVRIYGVAVFFDWATSALTRVSPRSRLRFTENRGLNVGIYHHPL